MVKEEHFRWHMEVAEHSMESRRVNIIPFSISSQVFLIKGRRKFSFGGFNKVCFLTNCSSPLLTNKSMVFRLTALGGGRIILLDIFCIEYNICTSK